MEQSVKQNNWIKNSVSLKLGVIAVIMLLLLIPSSMIKRLIKEREGRKEKTVSEIYNKWGTKQSLSGPILTVPYKTFIKKEEKVVEINHYAHFLPEKLDIKGELIPEIRYRGIYNVIAYRAQLDFSGSFESIDFSDWKISSENIQWNEAFLTIGISDMRGINENIIINWGGNQHSVTPGVNSKDLIRSGVSSNVKVEKKKNYNFSFKIDINGSEMLNFTPIGKVTDVEIFSTWNTPSFNGAILPDKREITKDGFKAKWNVLQLNRNYPQKWIDEEFNLNDSQFGVNLIFPVDIYQKSIRSVKYSLLFIVLTFLIFFFAEILTKNRIHPIQYLIVGFALCVFYSFLIALSEHIDFNLAYLIASISIISLISVFTKAIFKNTRIALIVCSALIVLYVFLFTILQLMEYSLLMGNIGLIVVLAIVMFYSRKIDWYGKINT